MREYALHGVGVRNLYLRHGVYYLYASVGGKRIMRKSPYQKKGEAAKWSRDFMAAARAGKWEELNRTKERRDMATMGELFAAYREAAKHQFAVDGKPSGKTVETNVSQMANIIRKVTGSENVERLRLDVIGRKLATSYVEGCIALGGEDFDAVQRARVTAASTLRQAKSLFTNWAMGAYGEMKLNLGDGVQEFMKTGKAVKPLKYHLPPLELREWTFDAVEDLAMIVTPSLRMVFVLCYDLGMRAGEARAAKWDWIEEEKSVKGGIRHVMRICRRPDWKGPKNMVDHSVPIEEKTYQWMMAWRPQADEYILPGGTDTGRHNLVNREFAGWMRSVGWDAKTYPKAAHELRKLAGSRWYTAAGLEWAAKWLGDTVTTVAHFYSDLDRKRDAVMMKEPACIHPANRGTGEQARGEIE